MTLIFGLSANLTALVNSVTTTLATVGLTVLIVVLGWKALHLVATDRIGAAFALLVVALVPAFFLANPAGAATFLANTVNSLRARSGPTTARTPRR